MAFRPHQNCEIYLAVVLGMAKDAQCQFPALLSPTQWCVHHSKPLSSAAINEIVYGLRFREAKDSA